MNPDGHSTHQIRRLIVNADDFGRSRSINQAVIRAHREGILTTASLMVSGEAFEEAADLARQNPSLGVGLHLTLVCGIPVVQGNGRPGLVRSNGLFDDNAPAAGMRFFFDRSLKPQLEREISAQFERFRQTGIPLDHVNGHLNIHLHPTVAGILLDRAREWGIRAMRLTRDPVISSLQLGRGRWGYRFSHALAFGALGQWMQPRLVSARIRHTDRVFGLLDYACIDENYVCSLLGMLPAGESELYSHPSLDEFSHEFAALVSPRARELVERHGIQLIRHSDL